MEQAITYIYIIISTLFIMNFINIWKHVRSGSNKVNNMSLLATSSLIFQFLSLAYFFYSGMILWVLISQLYMVLCMLYIKFIHKKDQR